MTKTDYDPAMLDELGYRLFDVACLLRSMSHTAREAALTDFQLHDRKALEWLRNLEEWVDEAQTRLRRECNRQRGVRRARRHLTKPADAQPDSSAPPDKK